MRWSILTNTWSLYWGKFKDDYKSLSIVKREIAQYGGGRASSEWAGRFWEIYNADTSSFFEAATPQVSLCGFDSILTILCNDYGQPTYNHNTLPKELIPAIDTGTYWMSKKSYNQVYYWCSDTLNVSFGLFEKELIDGKGWTYLYFKRPKQKDGRRDKL